MEVFMVKGIRMETVYCPSKDVVAREIEGVILIVPIVSGIGDMEDELFSLNETGKALWKKLDGSNTLKDIAEKLAKEFNASLAEIQKDVRGLIHELLKRRIVEEKSPR
jgi:hypothetical protein